MKDEIRCLVEERLGCQCPPEVYESISIESPGTPGPMVRALREEDASVVPWLARVVSVGGRLLLLQADISAPADIERLLRVGAAVRDRIGHNRVRLALPCLASAAGARFSALGDRVHVHFGVPLPITP